MRSFTLNSEVSLVLFDRELNARLRDVRERYFAASDVLVQSEWTKRRQSSKIIENIARLLSPLL